MRPGSAQSSAASRLQAHGSLMPVRHPRQKLPLRVRVPAVNDMSTRTVSALTLIASAAACLFCGLVYSDSRDVNRQIQSAFLRDTPFRAMLLSQGTDGQILANVNGRFEWMYLCSDESTQRELQHNNPQEYCYDYTAQKAERVK